MTALAADFPLPPLREELRLEPAEASAEGEARWRFYDPLRHRFFLIGDADVKLLSLWACGTVGALRAALGRARATLDEAQLGGLIDFLTQHHLVQPAPGAGSRKLLDAAKRQHVVGWRWLLQRYLGMRFALWRPQAFLDATVPLLAGLRPAFAVWAALTGFGLFLVTRQWDQFTGTFSEFLSPGGVFAYSAALLLLKVVHEMGHAYAAAYHGCRVGSMGVSVMMGVPMLYTETTEASRLSQPRQKMWIAAGGVIAESLVAGLATLAWAVLPDGSARSIAFVLATSSWLMSLTVNLNPFSRFDGYYFISDALRIENLQSRSLAYAGWALGRVLFGRIEAPPETVSRRRAIGFSAYGTAVWVYRIGLYTGMAALAYTFLFKAAGIAVGAFELWLFIGKPLWRRATHWWSIRQRVTGSRRGWLGAAGGGLLLLLVLPFDRSVEVPAMLTWQHETVLQAPENAHVLEVAVQPGQTVKAGALLLRLESPEVLLKRAQARINRLTSGERLDRISGDAQDRSDSTVLAQQRSEADADLQGLDARAALLELRAPADGVVADMPPHLQPGQWVRPELTLVRLLHGSARDARGFVAERELPRLQPGAAARFIAEDPALPSLPLTLVEVEPTAAEQVTPAAMSSLHGGHVAAQQDASNREVPVVAQHRIRFSVNEPATKEGSAGAAAINPGRVLPISVRGEVKVDAAPQSLLELAGRQVWRLLMVELRD